MGLDANFDPSTSKLTRADISKQWMQFSFEDGNTLNSIFTQAAQFDKEDSNKQAISGAKEWNEFRRLVFKAFGERASAILSKFNLPSLSNEEINSFEQPAKKNLGALPPKTPDGSLTSEQVQQYIENTPGTHVLRERMENTNDTTEAIFIRNGLAAFEDTLKNWKDTPEGQEGGVRTINGVKFTDVKNVTLPDGTKVFHTAQGWYELAANGVPGKKLDAEALAEHGYTE